MGAQDKLGSRSSGLHERHPTCEAGVGGHGAAAVPSQVPGASPGPAPSQMTTIPKVTGMSFLGCQHLVPSCSSKPQEFVICQPREPQVQTTCGATVKLWEAPSSSSASGGQSPGGSWGSLACGRIIPGRVPAFTGLPAVLPGLSRVWGRPGPAGRPGWARPMTAPMLSPWRVPERSPEGGGSCEPPRADLCQLRGPSPSGARSSLRPLGRGFAS